MTEHPTRHPTLSADQDRWKGVGITQQGDTDLLCAPHDITIMLVEDEPAVRSVICRALHREGYQIIDASDGVEAITIVERRLRAPIDLLITDMDMPRLGGVDLATQLRAANWVQRVVFMTGDIFRPALAGGLTTVMLRKPFSLHQLLAAVQQLLNR